MVFIPPPPTGAPPGAPNVQVLPPMSVGQPSAAAAAGAAAAALLQRQLAQDGAPGEDKDGGWTEHQTGDGRKFFHNEETQTSSWEKPEVLMTPDERANDTQWKEYRIWDGRVFYHNKETKVSCWSMPPEIRKLHGEASGIDERTFLQPTFAEKRRAFWELMKEKGVDEDWDWKRCNDATGEELLAQTLDERTRKQCFAEMLSLCMRKKQIETRGRERNVARALERLIEERFSRPEDLEVTYEEAARQLKDEEAWGVIKSDVRRDEVFQSVMERLEEKHRKARGEKRAERVARLQRLMASDPELSRPRLRWRDAEAILAKRDELQEEDPPLEAIRIWASLRELRHAQEHEAEANAKAGKEDVGHREERKRRDDFCACLRDMAAKGTLLPQTTWQEFEALTESEQRRTALSDGPGATAMELFDEFIEDMKLRGFSAATEPAAPAAPAEPPAKRARSGWDHPGIRVKEELHDEPAPKAGIGATAAGSDSAAPRVAMPVKIEAVKIEPIAPTTAKAPPPMMSLPLEPKAPAPSRPAPEVVRPPGKKAMPVRTSTELLAKRVEELRAICRQMGLPVSGRKQELVDRVLAAQ